MKFSALNVDFDGPSLDFPGLRKSAHEGGKERYPRKSHYFTVVGQSYANDTQLDIRVEIVPTSVLSVMQIRIRNRHENSAPKTGAD